MGPKRRRKYKRRPKRIGSPSPIRGYNGLKLCGLGHTVTRKGYARITSGPHRHKLEHRVRMAEMCREWCYYPLAADGIPEGFDVHHFDWDKRHNCRSNLLLIEHRLHYYADMASRRDKQGVYGRFDIPQWAVFTYVTESCPDCGQVREIPVGYVDPEAPDWVLSEAGSHAS